MINTIYNWKVVSAIPLDAVLRLAGLYSFSEGDGGDSGANDCQECRSLYLDGLIKDCRWECRRQAAFVWTPSIEHIGLYTHLC